MITPSFSLTATERVLPKLALDFTTASLDPRVTFTRTTGASNPATYTNSSGVIAVATDNQPRFDYDPVTLICKGLLIEESRTNALTYSQDFSQSVWNPLNSTVNATAVTAPDGTLTGAKLISQNASGIYPRFRRLSTLPNSAQTVTIYAKKAEWSYMAISQDGNRVVYYNIDNGTIVSSDTSTGTITSAGNGWYRCTYTQTGTAAGTTVALAITAGNTASYGSQTGDGTSGIYVWGAQLEAGAFATSYIPTTTTALTRNADLAAMTGTNFSSWYNQPEGALYAEIFNFPTVSTGRAGVATMKAATASSSIAMGRAYAGGTVNVLYGGCFDTATQAYIAGATVVTNTLYKMCMAYKVNSFAISVNGATVVQDTFGTVPTLTNMEIGCYDGVYFLNSCVRKIMFYPQRLTNAEVQAFTK